jgi:hypothetical protein
MLQTKPAITFNNVWPAIILQNNRVAKLRGLKIYEIISMGTNKNPKTIEVPEGKKRAKICNPCFLIANIFIPIKIDKLINKVIIK